MTSSVDKSEVLSKVEKRKRLDQPRQAQDKPAERLLFNLLDGLACDLEGLGAGAGQVEKQKRALLIKIKKALLRMKSAFFF
ncbi:hypothetical protein [Bacillus sp. USDA818B3_A]|uniref:hypothetical protein n=1 Tax=Bacillus sp. USDA818B3_A TaxID=2698834 RepID=UPI00136F1DCD|nr:hypothetical protein [Bacillus sp. USDA818B3_A]